MNENKSQTSMTDGESKPSLVNAIKQNRELVKHVMIWHCMFPSVISIGLWAITYGHSNALREFLVFFASQIVFGVLSFSGINFSKNLKEEFLENEPKENQPEWFNESKSNREEI
ncbi:hypothetical protein [Pseudomonas aeruginosa]|uniref:hypothetical protein n=1 Tax=Pseudomonas aeruginosa TaxID=287 RepID=UPI00117A1E42|nr:hypothetical protein [Pseudomonas aeruginosa]